MHHVMRVYGYLRSLGSKHHPVRNASDQQQAQYRSPHNRSLHVFHYVVVSEVCLKRGESSAIRVL